MFQRRNIASVSWTDQLIFGEGDGRLDRVSALKRRLEIWGKELGAGIVHWRCTRDRIQGAYYAGRGHEHFFRTRKPEISWDDFHVVPELAHDLGMKVLLYVSLFDEGWPLLPKNLRERSYHNNMHCQHVSWQSDFSRRNPDYTMVDRTAGKRQWGVLCLAYPEVRGHMIGRFHRFLASGKFDGLFVCLRSQSKPADFADQYGFNEPIRRDYLARYGKDIRHETFDLDSWRELLGEYLTKFFLELRQTLKEEYVLAVGAPRGNILGPPLGNASLHWARWVVEGIVDHLVVDQNSSRCPSMWHELWPMHRGDGYVQDYLTGFRMQSLEQDLTHTYGPVFCGTQARLYVATQWQIRSEEAERTLTAHPSVEGLVFSTFRHDNPGPVRRNQWVA